MRTIDYLNPAIFSLAKSNKGIIRYLISGFWMITNILLINGCTTDLSNYHSYSELSNELTELQSLYSDISEMSVIGHTHMNRDIHAIKISDNVETDEDEPVIYIDGGIHGNEWISVEVAFNTAKHLLENYNSDTRIKNIIDNAEIWIVPMLNPDGHVTLENESNPSVTNVTEIGRKNGRDDNQTFPGVDLNRNYDSAWGDENDGTSHDPSSIFYCGPEAFSEPETQAVRDLLNSIVPSATIAYHSYGQYVAYAGQFDETFESLAENMASLIKDTNGKSYDHTYTYKSGGEKEWIFDTFSIPAFVVELRPTATPPGYMLPSEQIEDTVSESLSGSLFLMEWVIDNS